MIERLTEIEARYPGSLVIVSDPWWVVDTERTVTVRYTPSDEDGGGGEEVCTVSLATYRVALRKALAEQAEYDEVLLAKAAKRAAELRDYSTARWLEES